MPMTGSESVGVIGLGLMGTALSARLMDAGIIPIGFDIDAKRSREFGVAGGELAVSATALAARCRTIIVAVYGAGQVDKLLAELERSEYLKQTAMICTTTCAPDEIAAIAERAAASGVALLEAPISGTSAEVREGSALALVAGDADAVEAAATVLDVIAPKRVKVGGIGDASRTKLALNLILQNNRAALAEGIVFAERLGLDPRLFLSIARESAAYSSVMDTKGEKMLMRDFTPQSHISQTLKDAELILAEGRRRSLQLPVTSAQTDLLRAAIALRGGECDSSAIIEAIAASRLSDEKSK